MHNGKVIRILRPALTDNGVTIANNPSIGILYIVLPPERHPNANRLKASEIEEKIGVNIKFNIDPDFLFDLRELLIRFS